ncbi:TorD/DmsD family molecular chaperone [Desulfocurvus sp. DL9XJH121]
MDSARQAGPVAGPDKTVLGTFLQFTGVACRSFHEIAAEPGMPVLARAADLAESWRVFFDGAGIQASLGPLETALHGLLEDEAVRAEALAEFDALFRVPELPVPLWESVWVSEEKTLFTEETCAVRDWYARFRWEIGAVGYEAEDHIGFETAFCGWLFDAAMAEHDPAGRHPQPTLADLRAFLDAHFARWAPRCLADLAARARTPFWSLLLTAASRLSGVLAQEL